MKKSQWKIPEDVLKVRAEIASWRANRKKRGPVPETIWSSAVILAERYSVYRISHAFRLNYGSLKHRLLDSSKAPIQSSGSTVVDSSGCHFIEITGAGMMSDASTQSITSRSDSGGVDSFAMEVEVGDGTGAQMTVRVSHGSGGDLLGLVGSFWSRGQ